MTTTRAGANDAYHLEELRIARTVSAVTRALSHAGFRHVTVDRRRHFVVNARR